jgi:hypothetical protein
MPKPPAMRLDNVGVKIKGRMWRRIPVNFGVKTAPP